MGIPQKKPVSPGKMRNYGALSPYITIRVDKVQQIIDNWREKLVFSCQFSAP